MQSCEDYDTSVSIDNIVTSDTEGETQQPRDGRLVVPAITYDATTREQVKIPDDVKLAVESFEPPDGTTAEGRVTQSFIYSWGIYCRSQSHTDAQRTPPRFFCLASEKCRRNKTVIPCKHGDRSNVSKHMRAAHNLTSRISLARADNSAVVKSGAAKLLKTGRIFGVGMERYACNGRLRTKHDKSTEQHGIHAHYRTSIYFP